MALPFVSEQLIEEVLDTFSTTQVMENAMNNLFENQPELLAFLQQESLEVLTTDEKHLLFVLVTATFEACKKVSHIPMVSMDLLGTAEEANWDILSQTKKKQFRHRLDAFFDQSNQEDILAFFEDALMEEDNEITDIGREPIFIAALSTVQALEAALSE